MAEKRDRRITIRVTQDIYDKVNYLAEEEVNSMTGVISKLILKEYANAKRRKN